MRIQHAAKHRIALQHNAIHTATYNATHCHIQVTHDPWHRSDTQCNTATQCNALQHFATLCNTLQHTTTHYNTQVTRDIWHSSGKTHCNTLQHTATHCRTMQHTAPPYNALQHTIYPWLLTQVWRHKQIERGAEIVFLSRLKLYSCHVYMSHITHEEFLSNVCKSALILYSCHI